MNSSLFCPAFISDNWPALCQVIDVYCERTDGTLYSEPLNAWSNAAMPVAALICLVLYFRRPNPDSRGLILAMIAAIFIGGFGAALFHTTAMVWTVWVDMFPFLVFMLLVLWLTLRRFFHWPRWGAALGLAAFVLVAVGSGPLFRGLLPFGVYYFVPLAVLAVVSVLLARRRSPAAASYGFATLTFAAAIAARELDGPLCSAVPFGTHFLWHLLAALLAFILIRAAILYAPARQR